MEFEKSPVQLQHYLMIAKRRWLPASAAFMLVCALSAIGFSLKKTTYIAESKLRFERANLALSVTGLSKESDNLKPFTDQSSPLTTEAEVLRSLPIVSETINKLNLRNQDGSPLQPDVFLKKLRVTAIKETDILTVGYSSSDPDQAARVVNTLISIYLDHNIQSHRTEAIAARKFIEQQLPSAEKRVQQAEENLRRFKEDNQVISLPEEAKSSVEAMIELQEQLTAAKAQIGDTNAQVNAYQNDLGIDPQRAKALVTLTQDPGVQDLSAQIQRLETELSNQRLVLQPSHPQILNLEERLADLKRLLQERATGVLGNQNPLPDGNWQLGTSQQELSRSIAELNSRRDGLMQQLATLSKAESTYRERTNLLPRLEKEQRELERQLAAFQSTYSQLLQKLGEVRIAENEKVGNAQVIAPAQLPNRAVSNIIALLATSVLGLLAAGLTAYSLEARDQTIKTIEQAKQVFAYTVLGVIPDDRQMRQLIPDGSAQYDVIVEQIPSSVIGAAYRILQTNLKFLSSKPLKVIVVSSSVPKEGKSTVSANLAASIAQSGKRVLLVDADLHHPSQHQLWHLSNEVGLSHLLVEQAAFGKAAKCVTSNLDVLTAGVTPPNTLALLDSQRMATLIDQFSENYDIVILDTPPLNLATDALILGKMANGILTVVRPELVKIGSASFAKGLLDQSGQTVLGQVINGVVVKNEPHSHYYFADTFSGGAHVKQSPLPD